MKPMEHYTGLYDGLVQELFATEQVEKNIIVTAEKRLLICRKHLLTLHADFVADQFEQTEDEIRFFKEIRPKFYSFFMFYQKLYAIEINRPVGHRQHEESYLYKELEHLTDFFEEHRFIYHYYRTGDTYLDEKWFTTLPTKNQVAALTVDPNADNGFSTVYSDLFARIIAHDRLQTYLQQEVSKLHVGKDTEAPVPTTSAHFHWTGAKVWVAELIYALYAVKVINGGQAHLNKITEQFSHAFNIPISNIYKVLEEIRLRKKNRTVFLDMLKTELLLQMERDDEAAA